MSATSSKNLRSLSFFVYSDSRSASSITCWKRVTCSAFGLSRAMGWSHMPWRSMCTSRPSSVTIADSAVICRAKPAVSSTTRSRSTRRPSLRSTRSFTPGKSSYQTPGLSASMQLPTDTFDFRLRRISCPRGTISLLTHAPSSEQASPKAAGHFMTE